MPSDLQVSNIRDLNNANSAISIASDGQITVNQNNPTITLGSNATGFTGIKNADQWRTTADVTTEGTITTSLEQVDTDSFSQIGTGMTQSSGVFSFPVVGVWYITAQTLAVSTSGAVSYAGIYINVATDGSSPTNTRAISLSGVSATSHYGSGVASLIFNVTSTSTHKVAFYYSRPGSTSPTIKLEGSTTTNYNTFTFIRLGDN